MTQTRSPARLDTLRATGLLDADADAALDRLTRIASGVLRTPIALVSLVDADRQFFASQQGLDEPWATRRETPLSHSFCQIVVETDAPLVVVDATVDARVCDNVAVPELGVQAYAGFPLKAPDGSVLGSFCVIDTTPRVWTADELAIVEDLAQAAASEVASRLANRDLLDAREELATVLRTAQDAFVAMDASGTVTAWNPAAERLFGWPADAAIGQRVAELIIPPRHQGMHRSGLDRVQTSRESTLANQRIELSAQHRDGHEFPIEMTLTLSERGSDLHYYAFLHDISERAQAHRDLEVQHAVAAALADARSAEQAATATVVAVARALGWACGEYWQVDPSDTRIERIALYQAPEGDLELFVRAEPAPDERGQGLAGVAWQTGRPVWIADTAVGSSVFRRQDLARRAGLRAAVGLPVVSGEQVIGVLTYFVHEPLPATPELSATLAAVSAHLGAFMERRRSEDLTLALAAARDDFNRVIANVDDYLWSVRVGVDEPPETIYASPHGRGVFGGDIPPTADLSSTVRGLLHPDDRAAYEQWASEISVRHRSEIECRIVGFDGVARWIWTRVTARRIGADLYVDGISTDVTERHALTDQREALLQRERDQVERLQQLDRMKDELVAVVSHELRTPITSVRGYTELILDDPALPADLRDFAVKVERNSEHLQSIVDDLLTLARNDRGALSVQVRPISLARLLRDTVAEFERRATEQGVSITSDIAGHLLVEADATRLRQLFDNLVSNAIKYTPAGGSVRVRAAAAVDGRVTVAVSDSGIGIPDAEYPRLFERFFRASTARKHGISGTGLGLSITRAIAEAHGGSITAAPNADSPGTTFTVDLPAIATDSVARRR